MYKGQRQRPLHYRVGVLYRFSGLRALKGTKTGKQRRFQNYGKKSRCALCKLSEDLLISPMPKVKACWRQLVGTNKICLGLLCLLSFARIMDCFSSKLQNMAFDTNNLLALLEASYWELRVLLIESVTGRFEYIIQVYFNQSGKLQHNIA